MLAMAVPAARMTMIALLVIGGLNTALSLFYYVRVVKVMTLDDEPDARAPASFSLASIPGVFVAAVTVPMTAATSVVRVCRFRNEESFIVPPMRVGEVRVYGSKVGRGQSDGYAPNE